MGSVSSAPINIYGDLSMGKLTDILSSENDGSIQDLWDSTAAADEITPLPVGKYVCRLRSGELGTSRSGTPQYTLRFEVLEGDHSGRQIWHSVYLTQAALPMTKRDLGRIGITSLNQLESPVPKGLRCSVHVVLRKTDEGTEHNRVKSFEVLGVDPPEVDAFAPDASTTTGADKGKLSPDAF